MNKLVHVVTKGGAEFAIWFSEADAKSLLTHLADRSMCKPAAVSVSSQWSFIDLTEVAAVYCTDK